MLGSSRHALESAYQQEAKRLTRQMDRRLISIRAELDERLASLSVRHIDAGAGADPSINAVVVVSRADMATGRRTTMSRSL